MKGLVFFAQDILILNNQAEKCELRIIRLQILAAAETTESFMLGSPFISFVCALRCAAVSCNISTQLNVYLQYSWLVNS